MLFPYYQLCFFLYKLFSCFAVITFPSSMSPVEPYFSEGDCTANHHYQNNQSTTKTAAAAAENPKLVNNIKKLLQKQ